MVVHSSLTDRTLKLMYQNSNELTTTHKVNVTPSSQGSENIKPHAKNAVQSQISRQRKLNFCGQFDGCYSSGES